MKRISILTIMAVVIISSCTKTTYYQVYQVKSDNVAMEDDKFSDENSDCKITYNMWAEGGDLSFMLYNKTDKNIYLIMPKSSFILNGIANDYYNETTMSESMSISAQGTYYKNYSLKPGLWNPLFTSRTAGITTGIMSQKTKSTKEKEVICIPPKSAKIIQGFNLLNVVYKDCENTQENYPKTTSTLIDYTQDSSPLTFRNRVAYSFDEKGEDIHFIDHSFWLASVQNYSEKAAKTSMKFVECESTYEQEKKVFIIDAPFKFYNSYLNYDKR